MGGLGSGSKLDMAVNACISIESIQPHAHTHECAQGLGSFEREMDPFADCGATIQDSESEFIGPVLKADFLLQAL